MAMLRADRRTGTLQLFTIQGTLNQETVTHCSTRLQDLYKSIDSEPFYCFSTTTHIIVLRNTVEA